MQYEIRMYRHADLASLAQIYRSSIRHFGSEYYSKDQITAWSSYPDHAEVFEKWLAQATTYVAVSSINAPIAFASIEEQGRISALFVAPEVMRKGVGTALLNHLIEEARSRRITTLATEASEFSKPLFEKSGFRVKEIEHTKFKDVRFSRYVMYKCIEE